MAMQSLTRARSRAATLDQLAWCQLGADEWWRHLQLEDKQLLGASLREAAIKAVLQRLALLLRLLHGPMDALLAKVTLSPHHVRHFARQAA